MASLVSLLGFVIPMSLLAAVSPLIFLNSAAIAGGYGSAAAARFIGGNAVTLVVIGLLSMGLLGAGAAAFTEHELASSAAEGVLGVLLLAYAFRLVGARNGQAGSVDERSPGAGRGVFGWGVLSMATNFTTLPLYIAVLQRLGFTDVTPVARIVIFVGVVVIVLTPAWLPAALLGIRPSHMLVSTRTREKVAAGTRIISVSACVLGGLFLIGHALW